VKASELIQFVAKDMLDDRVAMLSGESDELWSDASIARHLAEAERILCRRAWVLEDSAASAVTRIQLVENKYEYPLDPSILFLKAARLSDSEIDLVRVGYNDNRPYSVRTDPATAAAFWDVNATYIENAGRPSRYSTDFGSRVLRVRQKPNADAALLKLYLTVVRMPVNAISADAPDLEPECPKEYHMDLALYAAGRCLSLPTVDGSLRSLGKQYLADFDSKVAEAKRDRQRFQQSMPQFRFGGWASDNDGI
jgi:hypothetical protein